MDSLTDDDHLALVALAPAALLLLDRAARIRHANPAAQALLAATTMLPVKHGALTARRKAEDKELRDALAALTPASPAASVCLRNREQVPMAVIDLRLLPSGTVAVRITDLAVRPSPSLARLRLLFGLTQAEARVAAALLSGLGIQAVAQEHGVEAETVRTQVKRLRSKTGTRSQNQLLAVLIAAGPDLGSVPASPSPAGGRGPG